MPDQWANQVWISGEIAWVKLKSWILLSIPLTGLAVILVGAYGMLNLGYVPQLETLAVPSELLPVRELAVSIAETWIVSIPLGAALTHFSLKL